MTFSGTGALLEAAAAAKEEPAYDAPAAPAEAPRGEETPGSGPAAAEPPDEVPAAGPFPGADVFAVVVPAVGVEPTVGVGPVTLGVVVVTFETVLVIFGTVVVTFETVLVTFETVLVIFGTVVVTFETVLVTFETVEVTFDTVDVTFAIVEVIGSVVETVTVGVGRPPASAWPAARPPPPSSANPAKIAANLTCRITQKWEKEVRGPSDQPPYPPQSGR